MATTYNPNYLTYSKDEVQALLDAVNNNLSFLRTGNTELQKSVGYARLSGSVIQYFHSSADASLYDSNRTTYAGKLLTTIDLSSIISYETVTSAQVAAMTDPS